MAIFASSSTITTQTVPLITVDLSDIQNNYVLQWNSDLGSFVATTSTIQPIVDLSNSGQVTGILPVEYGGTNNTVFQNGDLVVAKITDGITKLESIEIENDNTQKVLSIQDGFPLWQNIDNIKNITLNRIVTVTDENTNIGQLLPSNTIVSKIKISVNNEYTDTSLTIGTNSIVDDVLTVNSTVLSDVGIYVYELNKFYEEPTQLSVFLDGNSDGSMQVFLEYIII
jgi:hypothetical protein